MNAYNIKILWPEALSNHFVGETVATTQPISNPEIPENSPQYNEPNTLMMIGGILLFGVALAYSLDRNAKDTAESKNNN